MAERLGRILALDYGLKRIGLAVTDVDRTMVFPRPVLENRGHMAIIDFLRGFCRDEGVSLILLGCPYDDAHVENEQTQKIRQFGAKLEEALEIPVAYEDEKYTTAESEAMLEEFGMDFSERKRNRDGVAAMLILQSYLKRV